MAPCVHCTSAHRALYVCRPGGDPGPRHEIAKASHPWRARCCNRQRGWSVWDLVGDIPGPVVPCLCVRPLRSGARGWTPTAGSCLCCVGVELTSMPRNGLWPVTARPSVVHRSLLLVEAERRVGGWVSVETRYVTSSHPPKARHLLATARAHGGIATGLHWVLDVAFREDESQVRTGDAPATCTCCGAWRSTCSGRAPPSRPVGHPVSQGRPQSRLHGASPESRITLQLHLVLEGSRWCRSCSIIDAPPDVRHLRRGMRQTALCRSCLNRTGGVRTSPMGVPD
jgi:hypothetical protein